MKKTTIAAAVIFAVIIAASGCGTAPAKWPSLSPSVIGDAEASSYLQAHHAAVVLDGANKNANGLQLLDIGAYDIFLAGEYHATKKNFTIKSGLLKHLNQTAGVNHLLLESGYASAAYINLYLKSGDRDILNDFMSNLKGTFSYTIEHAQFWQDLYIYNQSRPEEQRISAVGVDIEHQWNSVVKYLKALIAENRAPDTIKPAITQLRMHNGVYNQAQIEKIITTLSEDLDHHQSDYQEFLGEDFFDFEFSVKNCMSGIDAYSDTSSFAKKREAYIWENFKTIYAHLGGVKMFGQWGAEHVYQTPCATEYVSADDKRFAIFLNQPDSPVTGKVCSIMYVYSSSAMWNKNGSLDITNGSLVQTAVLDPYTTSDYTLFDLRAEASPFFTKSYFIAHPTTERTLDYFQYVLSIKDSEPCTPYSLS